jgi:hypothetical protein
VTEQAGVVYAAAMGEPIELAMAPQKLSSDRTGAPSQLALARYLGHAKERATPALQTVSGPLALRLDVGLAAGVDPLHEHDLDNFLHPLVKHLDPKCERFVSAWATKAPRTASYLRAVP